MRYIDLAKDGSAKQNRPPMPKREAVGKAAAASLRRSDYAGVSILAVLVIAFSTVELTHTHAGNSFIGYICRTLDLPVGFAEDGWDLRATIGPLESFGPASQTGNSSRNT